MVKNNSFITIQGFMRNELDLSGNELLVYAVVYGFSQDDETYFSGSRNYIADWCGISVRQVQTILNGLFERKLINKYEKEVNGVRRVWYRNNYTSGEEKTSLGGEKTSLGGENISLGGVKKLHGGCEKTSPYNIDNNIENNNIDNNIVRNNGYRNDKVEVVCHYGNYGRVILTDEQKDKLENQFGKDMAHGLIEYLDNYCESTGRTYNNYYQTIMNWVVEKYTKEKNLQQQLNNEDRQQEYDSSKNEEPNMEELERFLKEREGK